MHATIAIVRITGQEIIPNLREMKTKRNDHETKGTIRKTNMWASVKKKKVLAAVIVKTSLPSLQPKNSTDR